MSADAGQRNGANLTIRPRWKSTQGKPTIKSAKSVRFSTILFHSSKNSSKNILKNRSAFGLLKPSLIHCLFRWGPGHGGAPSGWETGCSGCPGSFPCAAAGLKKPAAVVFALLPAWNMDCDRTPCLHRRTSSSPRLPGRQESAAASGREPSAGHASGWPSRSRLRGEAP